MDITNGLTLSGAVKDKNTPLRQYLQAAFPNPRQLQAEYKARSGALLVESAGAPAGTVGTAMDLLVRLLLDPTDVPQSARRLLPFSGVYLNVVDELAATAGNAAGADQRDTFSRAVWALALCVEAYRSGAFHPSIVIELHNEGKLTLKRMMAQATPVALLELSALRVLAEERLIPRLERPFYLGPEFDASKSSGIIDTRLIAAEADLIANGLLLDIKTALGPKNSAGSRPDTLKPDNLYQLLAYALLDHSDTYAIDSVGLYSARYGGLFVWPLDYVTSTMAGHDVDFQAAREKIWEMLNRDE